MKRSLSSTKVANDWSGTSVKKFKRARLNVRSNVWESNQIVSTKHCASRSKGTSEGIEQARLIEQLRKENMEKTQQLIMEQYKADKKLQAEILLRTQVEKRLLKEKLKRCEVEKKYLLERQRRMELDNRRHEFRRMQTPRVTTRPCYLTWNELGGWQNPLTRKHKFTWLNDFGFTPPEAIVKHILKFLNDDNLFRLRGTSLMFYETFYSQEVSTVEGTLETSCPFNATRAIKLAWKGRVFKRLQALHTTFNEDRNPVIFSSLSSDDLSVINPRFFPKLRSLRLGQTRDGVSLRGLPPHPCLISITGPSYEEDDYMYITDEKFPKLKSLDLFYNFMAKFTRLSNLEVLGVDCEEIAWEEINHRNFPRLRLLRVRRNEIPKAVRTRLYLCGVECIVEETESDDDDDDGSEDELDEESDSGDSYIEGDHDDDAIIINFTDSASED